jgi:general secretion pathway protein B
LKKSPSTILRYLTDGDELTMSYILEALRKSEKERKQEENPLLQAVHTPGQVFPTEKKIVSSKFLLWIFTFVLLLVSTLGVLIWRGQLPIFHLEQRHTEHVEQQIPVSLPESPVMEKRLTEQQSTEMPQRKKARLSKQTGEELSPETAAEGDSNIIRTIIREPAPLTLARGKDDEIPAAGGKVPEISASINLSPSVQTELLKMKFAGHVYSEDRDRRMIMINNKILREGEGIDTDFRLDEITRSGVILLYQSARIRIGLF